MTNITEIEPTEITENNIPMDVREHMMRGQWDDAITLLTTEHNMTEDNARMLIRRYRKSLKERNLALEVQKMQSTFDGARKEPVSKSSFYGKMMTLVIVFLLILVLISYIIG